MRKTYSGNLESISSVVCDDIRREDNGKMMLIGVYGKEMTVGALPAVLSMSIFIIAQSNVSGDVSFEMRVMEDEEFHITPNIPLSVNVPTTLTATIVVKGLPINIRREGRVVFQWKMAKEDEWRTLFELDVKKVEVSETAQAEAPSVASGASIA